MIESTASTVKVWQLRPRLGGEAITLGHEYSLGRDEDCHVVLGEQYISRKHAVFLIKNDSLFIQDNRSANGTFVNGQQVNLARLDIGDSVRFDRDEYEVIQTEVELPAKTGDDTLGESGRVLFERLHRPKHQLERRSPVLVGLVPPIVDVRFPLEKSELSLGRVQGNDIVVPAPTVSSRHAQLHCVDEEWFVTDLDSSNGTMLNGKRITHEKINAGDTLTVGGIHLRFELEA